LGHTVNIILQCGSVQHLSLVKIVKELSCLVLHDQNSEECITRENARHHVEVVNDLVGSLMFDLSDVAALALSLLHGVRLDGVLV